MRYLAIMLAIVGVIIGVPFALYEYAVIAYPDGELAQKDEWSTLQAVLMRYSSGEDKPSPLIEMAAAGSGFNLIGFAAPDSRFHYVWVIANPTTNNPRVKIMPDDVKFDIKCSDIQTIKQKISLDPAVQEFLRNRCEEQPDKS